MSTGNVKHEPGPAPKPKTAKVTIKNVSKPKPMKSFNKPAPKIAAATKGTKTTEIPDGLPKKYFIKSTFNTHDIMHSPVEKTILMIDKILSGERLFTM
jgi:hypothetical protein